MFRSWWQRLVGGKFPPLTQSARKSRGRVRPGLEQLEDRCVPATFTVTNLNDSGTGSLREAIAFANDETNNPGADTIVFQSGLSGQMNLSTADNTTYGPSAFLITSNITIDGFSGGGSVVLARSVAATNLRLFRVDVGANLSLDGLTVKGFKLTGFNGSDGGYGGGGGGGAGLGGAILNQGTLTITRCLFQNNEAVGGKGGGVPDVTSGGGGGGGLSGAGGAVSGSTGGAGGLDGGGTGGNFGGGNGTNGGFGGGGGGGAASLGQAGNGGMGGFGGGGGGAGVNGDIAQNGTYGQAGYGGGQGGAVQSNTGGVGGGGAGMGGGIFNWGGTLTITNSTFHNNKAQGGTKGAMFGGSGGASNGAGFGGAVFSYNGSVTSRNNTFSNNIADQGGGVYHLGDGATATSTVKNTILANSSGSGNDYFHDSINAGSVTLTLNNNVIERHQVGLAGVVSTADPGLGALQNNGGPTFTMAITSASNAYNTGNDSDATGLSTDQRGTGFARLVGVVDIGAFELAPSLPPAPSTPDLSAGSDSGPSTTDNNTNDNTPTFTGTAQANSTVKLFNGATQIGSTTANGSGNWTITASSLSDGSHSITATATNADGTGPASSALSITIDTQTPATPSITSFSQDSGTTGDNITNDNTITLNGTADPNSTITVFNGGSQLGTATANGSGNWTYTTGTLSNAVHSFTARASDTAGNQSGSSSALSVTVDTSVNASNLSFADDSGVVGDGITNDATVTLSGTADPFSSVRVIVDYTIDLETTTADAGGNWSVQATLTSASTNVYYAIVTDVAGNTTTTAQLSIVLDTEAPSAPSLTGFSDDSGVSGDAVTNDTTLTLSGSAEGLSTVTIYDGSTELGTTIANEMGDWTFTTTTLSDSAHSFTATASDAAGNESSASTALVVTVDTQAPNAPSITGYSQDSGIQGDNRTNDATITLSGTADPNSTVTVFDGASELGTTTANGSGNWTYTTSSLSDAAHSFTAKSADAAGNQSSASSALSVTVDTQAPNAPNITGYSQDSGAQGDNRTNDTTIALSGTAEANSTVALFDGATQLGTTTADGSGNWSYTTAALSDDAHSFTATATDAAGNTSSASTALSVTIDTQAPNTPSITGFSQDSGTSGDSRTNDDTVTLSGTAEPNSTVTVFDGANELGTTTTNGSGNWSYTTSSRSDGAHSFTATATDAAGNQSGASSALVVTIDTQAPTAPGITGFSQDSGVTGDSRTNDSTITLSGTAEPNSTVTVFDGATELGTATADGSGDWSYTTSTLGDGAHSFTVTATDAAGNTSVASSALSVTVDTQVPNAPSITGYSQDSGTQGDNRTNDNTVTLSGTAEPNSMIAVFDGATQLGTTTADGSGNWSYTTAALSDDAHSFTATATDAAGNTSSASTALSVTIDTQAPNTPSITGFSQDSGTSGDSRTNDDTVTLSGTAEPNSTVTVFDGASELGTTTANGSGNWSYTTSSRSDGAHSFTATATDAAGNQSGASSALVVTIDTQAPTAPSITGFSQDSGVTGDSRTNDSTITLSGTAEPNSTVTVFDGASELGSTTANGSGNWTYTTSVLNDAAHSFTATATDAAGNTSVASSALSVTVDTQAPNAPSITGYSQDSGTQGDNRTNDTTVTLSGTTEVISTVVVFDGATQLGAATVDGSGNWTYTTSALSDGAHSFTAVATDAAGNQGVASTALTVTVDTVAPATPGVPEVADDDAPINDGLTADDTLSLSGMAEVGATVIIYDDAMFLGAVVATDGTWQFTTDVLSDGLHYFAVTASDVAGNTSSSSTEVVVEVDTTPPSVPTITGYSEDTGTEDDGITRANTLTLTGTADPNTTVTVLDGTTALGTTTVNAQGAWSYTTTTLGDATHSFTATAFDVAYNTSAASVALSVTIDTLAPSAPAITAYQVDSGVSGDGITNANPLALSGTAEPNSTIAVLDGVSVLGSTTTNAQGAWTFTTPELSDGAHSFTATATDAAGNTSVASSALTVTVDTQAPSAPSVTAFSQDSGTTGDRLTNDATLTLSGSAEPNSTVTVFDGTSELGTTTADGQGAWSYTTSTLGDGAHSFTASATDAAGNQGTASSALVVSIDTAAPNAPSITGYSQDSGTSGDNLTNDSTLTLSGTAEPNSTVTVFDGATQLGTATATAQGNWTYTTAALSEGLHNFTATATDAAGITSVASSSLSVTTDTQAPIAPAITGFSQDSGTLGDNITSDTTVTLTGTAEPNSLVTLFDGTTLLGSNQADAQGAWSMTTAVLSEGVHSFTVTATDAADNTSVASTALSVTVDSQAPNAPGITGFSQDSGATGDNLTNDNTLTLSGTAEPNSTVTLFDGANQLGAATADAQGGWSFSTNSLSDGTHSFTATARDTAGNLSVASTSFAVTIDTQTPDAPSITSYSQDTGAADGLTSDTTLTLIGSAEPLSTVAVFGGATQLGTTTANAQGVWSYTTAVLLDGAHSLAARATDAAGNQSVSSAVLAVQVDTVAPVVQSIEAVGPTTVVSSTMQFTVTFNRSVTGVNLGDFQVTTTGTLSGVTPTNLQGAGAVYTVTVSVGSGSGTVRLDVTDDDSIRAVNDMPLDGAFTTGEVVSRRKAPTLTALDAPKGSGVVQVFNPDGSPRFNLTPFAGHTKGVDAAVGDVNGDGFSDVVTGVSRGGPPTVKVFDGLTGAELRTIVAFKATFTGGVSVAAGDVNGDGRADIIVGAGLDHGPKVNVYSGLDGSLIKSFLAYGTDFTGGVRVAAGDVNGDGRADVVTSQLSGAAMTVKVFSGLNFTVLDKLQPFGPFELSKTALAVGDFNNDGRADIAVIGGTQPLLRIYNGGSLVERASLKAFSALDGGLWLTAGDVNGDDVVDLIAVTGSNLEMRVKHFNGLTLAQLDNFFATFPAV